MKTVILVMQLNIIIIIIAKIIIILINIIIIIKIIMIIEIKMQELGNKKIIINSLKINYLKQVILNVLIVEIIKIQKNMRILILMFYLKINDVFILFANLYIYIFF